MIVSLASRPSPCINNVRVRLWLARLAVYIHVCTFCIGIPEFGTCQQMLCRRWSSYELLLVHTEAGSWQNGHLGSLVGEHQTHQTTIYYIIKYNIECML